MTPEQFWKNFCLLDEVNISGSFVYNGLRRFHEMKYLHHTEDIFEVFYNISVGIERLLKVSIVLLEHNKTLNIDELEKSLITHNHSDLLHRIREHTVVNLGEIHNEFLALLSTFYKSYRYDRFLASSAFGHDKEKRALQKFLDKWVGIKSEDRTFFGHPNTAQYKKIIHKTVTKITGEIYSVIVDLAQGENIETYATRAGSRAETVFLGEVDFQQESMAWKELVIYLINTKDQGGILDLIRSVPHLEFDPAMMQDYLEVFNSTTVSPDVADFVSTAYSDLPWGDVAKRRELLELIADPQVTFDFDEDEC